MTSNKTSDIASVRPKIRSKHSEKLMGEPLERKTMRFEDRDGIERYYPALHIRFSHTIVFTNYSRPPMKAMADMQMSGQNPQTSEHIHKWMANVLVFEEMVKNLLRLQHNQFWSTLVYERALQICLESYLRWAPRDHDLSYLLISNEMKSAVKRVHILMFKLYLRICSAVESKNSFISETTFGALVYENYLIDFPKMADLCVLYAHTNYRQLLTRMLSNVIHCQPRYEEDLTKGCAHMSDALNGIQERLGVNESQFESTNKLQFLQNFELQSLVSQVTDLSVSVQTLLAVLPQMAHHFRSVSLEKTIVEFYNRVFPLLQNELNSRSASIDSNDLISERNRKQLLISRSNLIQTFRDVLRNCFLVKLMDENLPSDSKVCFIDGLIETLTFASFERSFIVDYCVEYPIERDLNELSKHSTVTQFESFDKTRIDYLKSVIQSSTSMQSKASNESNTTLSNGYPEISQKVNGMAGIEEIDGRAVELESRIQYILEIIPDLGSGFVEQCLEFYDLDNEKVLNAILEDNLPPQLARLDRTLQKVPKKASNERVVKKIETPNVTAERTSRTNNIAPEVPVPDVIDQRENVYNNDEFDIFRNKDIDLNRIHLGKRDQKEPKLDDKTKAKIMAIHYKALEDEENQQFCDYDDEYDDTYEDDTQIDLPNDKLMEELEVKVINKRNEMKETSKDTSEDREENIGGSISSTNRVFNKEGPKRGYYRPRKTRNR